MELVGRNVKHPSLLSPIYSITPTHNNKAQFISFCNYPFRFHHLNKSNSCSITLLTHARKKDISPETSPNIIEQVSDIGDDESPDVGIDEDELLVDDDDDDFDEDFLDDGDYFNDGDVTEKTEVYAGDGAEGGGILLAGTWWDKKALEIAENVTNTFSGDLGMYAFKTLVNTTIQVRIEKLSTKSGSPSMSDIEAFSTAYRARLDEAELAKTIPENVSLEVSSPGVERVVCIPQDFDRFKERPMYVRYITDVESTVSSSESDGVFRLVSVDLENNSCTWGLADVRINREKAGKGRPMSKKQREWRLTTPLDSIRLVRIYPQF